MVSVLAGPKIVIKIFLVKRATSFTSNISSTGVLFDERLLGVLFLFVTSFLRDLIFFLRSSPHPFYITGNASFVC